MVLSCGCHHFLCHALSASLVNLCEKRPQFLCLLATASWSHARRTVVSSAGHTLATHTVRGTLIHHEITLWEQAMILSFITERETEMHIAFFAQWDPTTWCIYSDAFFLNKLFVLLFTAHSSLCLVSDRRHVIIRTNGYLLHGRINALLCLDELWLIIQSSTVTWSNGNIFRVTGPLCGEFSGHGWIPLTNASDAELWCFFHLRVKKPLCKQWRRRWFETPSCPVWRHCNDIHVMFLLMYCQWNLGLPIFAAQKRYNRKLLLLKL